VVTEGVTTEDPVPALTVPILGPALAAIVTDVAFRTTQLRVEDWPTVICEGEAVNVATLTGLLARMLTEVVAVAIRPSVFFTVKRKL
jgi:hypothetical protein